MQLGDYASVNAGQALLDFADYFGLNSNAVPSPVPLQQQALNLNQSWAGGMWSSYFCSQCAGASNITMSVPMLVGAGTAASGVSTSPQSPSDATGTGSNPTTMTLAAVAAGTWDMGFTKTFQTIQSYFPNAILRIGWELYGDSGFGWTWCGAANAAAHMAAFQHLVTLARTISPTFQFDWNGGLVDGAYNPMTGGAWPGASYVTTVSADVYDYYAPGGASGWTAAAAALAPGLAFAQAQGLPFSIPEFGLWAYGDDWAWIAAAYKWVLANEASLGYISWFNGPTGNATNLSQNPQCAAIFRATFGSLARQLAGLSIRRFKAPVGGGRARLI